MPINYRTHKQCDTQHRNVYTSEIHNLSANINKQRGPYKIENIATLVRETPGCTSVVR